MKNEPKNEPQQTPSSQQGDESQRILTLPVSFLDDSIVDDLRSSYGAFESARKHDRELIGYIPPDD